jgi:hypothetical protein
LQGKFYAKRFNLLQITKICSLQALQGNAYVGRFPRTNVPAAAQVKLFTKKNMNSSVDERPNKKLKSPGNYKPPTSQCNKRYEN